MKRIILLLFLLTGCTYQPPITCAEIRDNPILEVRERAIPQAEMVNWVVDHYDIGIDEVRKVDVELNQTWVNWTQEEVYHQVQYLDETLEDVYFTFSFRRIEGEAVIECLGQPDFYQVGVQQDESLSLYYRLLYIDEGIEIEGGRSIDGADPPSLLTPDLVFYQATIYDSGTMPLLQRWQSWKPWSSWAQMVIDDGTK